MSNPFDALRPQIDWTQQSRDHKLSRTRSENRSKALASDDPARRRAASGTIPGMGLTLAEKQREASAQARITGVNRGYGRADT